MELHVEAGVFAGDDEAGEAAVVSQELDLGGNPDRDFRQPPLKVVQRGDWLVGDRENQVALGHAGLCGRAFGLEMDDLDAAFLGQAEEAGDGPCDRNITPVQAEVAANDAPVLHELGEDSLDHVDRDGEADSLGRVNDRRVHADDPAVRVEQRAAAIAGVECSIGLDDVVDQVAGDAAQGAAEGADDAGGDG